MPQSLDLNLLPILRQAGQDKNNFPGLVLFTPPRKTARGRDEDRLVLYFSMSGNAPLNDQQQEQILARLGQTYYQTPGSVTSALRLAAETLNTFLLDRNLRASSSGKQCIGQLAFLVLRADRLTLAHCGPLHAYLAGAQEIQELTDASDAGRGLGLVRSISIRFYQTTIQSNDILVVTHELPAGWTANMLRASPNQGLESLRRRLLSQSRSGVDALLVQAEAGSGKLRLLRAKAPLQMAQPSETFASLDETAANSPQEAEPVEESAPASPLTESFYTTEFLSPKPVEELAQPEESTPEPEEAIPIDYYPGDRLLDSILEAPAPAAPAPSTPTPSQTPVIPPVQPAGATVAATRLARTPEPAPALVPAAQGASAEATPRRPAVDRATRTKAGFATLLGPLAILGGAIGKGVKYLLNLLGQFVLFVLRAILPDESIFRIPAATMAFIAITAAIVVATSGAYVYFQRGRTAQHNVLLSQASQSAQAAAAQQDPVELRTGWELTLDYLDKADLYGTSPDSETLRAQAIQALDELDGIVRLDFTPALDSGLADSMQIVAMVAVDNDLYLLNGAGGNVIRLYLSGQGYEIDTNFECKPNPNVGPIVDIAPLPKGGNLDASILAMDANANFLFCISGDLPTASIPIPPQSNWGKPLGFTLDTGSLYVLDPQTNAVWIFWNMNMIEQPRLFFGAQVPYMEDVIDLAVNLDDLYLLHSDGRVSTCNYSEFPTTADTRCEDPATFTDGRRGRDKKSDRIPDAQFSQMLFSLPPDPSIYLMDPVHQAIYHMSLRLTFQRQFRPQVDFPPGNLTAFAVSQNRVLFIALGNKVYYANLP